MPDTINGNAVTEEKDNARFQELNVKSDRTPEETKELGDIKERHAGRTEKRINTLTWEKKSAIEREEATKQELADARTEIDTLKNKPVPASVIEETITVNNKSFYTDEALQSMITAGKLTQAEGNKHYNDRIKAEASEDAYQRIRGEQEKTNLATARNTDSEKVLKDNPEFNPKHPNHNPNDPVLVKAMELYNDGLGVKANGLSKAIALAKQLLGKTTTKKPDLTDEFNLDPSRPGSGGGDSKEVTLDEDEQEAAIRIYTLGEAKNPKTGKSYTREEALKKALEAKTNRRRK